MEEAPEEVVLRMLEGEVPAWPFAVVPVVAQVLWVPAFTGIIILRPSFGAVSTATVRVRSCSPAFRLFGPSPSDLAATERAPLGLAFPPSLG